ncbi:MAG: heme lyase CcmF/NrfE family subunit [Deltaproteobacteria bacterium]|nr:heme lyase CcmF/NrfE family subunit [Deltaproteobacteria bacterium]MBN2673797.1 heme lyase CcmF/NrfE family subunit [Deltaproteobacteria bacterium]
MAQFGELSIIATAVITLAASILCLWKKEDRYVDAARRLFASAALMGTVAAIVLVFLLVTHDYRVTYVRGYADRTMSLGFLVTALWGGQQGSLMFWAVLQSWFAAAMAFWLHTKDRDVFRTSMGVMGAIAIFFWLLVLTQSNPFTLNGEDPLTSFGMNPLLRNPYMVFHPPTLFIGFAGFSVPLSVAIGVLATGKIESDWLSALRPWVLFAFIFLSIGNILGMVWAYEELGWGGYWGWDPVENASLMPWFTATALVHSMMAERRWGIFRRWNLSLIVVTYLLTLFGTFLTRSGVIQSVHAFSEATEGPYLLGAIIAVLVGYIYLLSIRFKALAPNQTYDTWSKQWMFEVTNWLFVVSVLFVGIATMWPLFVEVFKNEKATVTPAFFNKWMVPIGLTLFATIGACTLLPGGKSSLSGERKKQLLMQVGALTGLAVVSGWLVGQRPSLGGAMSVAPAIAAGLAVFVAGALLIQIRKSYLGGNIVRLGGQLVHLSVVLMYIGFTGGGLVSERQANMGRGEFMYIDDAKVTFMGLRTDVNHEREAVFADLEVAYKDGHVQVVSPARYLYHSHPKQPTSEVTILTNPARDHFFILGETEFRKNRAVIKVLVNPLVFWIWVGGVLLVIGTLLAMRKGGLRELLEMNRTLRRQIVPLGIGMVVGGGVLSVGILWHGVSGGVVFLGALALVVAFWMAARSVMPPSASPQKDEN